MIVSPSDMGNDGRRARPVRGAVWMILAAALALTLAFPLARLWQANSAPLLVHACIWPDAPQIGQAAELRVFLPKSDDRAALQGPWARLAAEWDMVTMAMGPYRTSLADMKPQSTHPVFSVPLRLSMAGPWVAHVKLSTPGRPVWAASLRFTVLAAGQSGGAPASGGASCHEIAGGGPQ